MKNKILLIATLGLLIAGCSKNDKDSSSSSVQQSGSFNSSSTISSVISSSSSTSNNQQSSSSDEPFEYGDFDDAIENTRYYGLKYSNMQNVYVEVNLPNMFFNSFSKTGYVALDNDPDYLHAFTTYYNTESESYELCMDVHGRAALKKDIVNLESTAFMSLITPYVDDFEQVTDNKWEFESTVLCREFSDYFQTKALKYCNLVELTINRENRFESMKVYEVAGHQKALVLNIIFDNLELKTVPMYDDWVKKGAIVNERIIDYKMLYPVSENEFISVYEEEEISFKATVVSKDSEGNVYVANKGISNENVGIKVRPTFGSDDVEINDIVEINGVVYTENFVTSISGSLKDTGEDATYSPIFDEEAIVDSYGGGVYAATFFSTVPYYSGSVYSTYAYVSDIPSAFNETEDTVIEVVCPAFVNGELMYHMQIIIPASLDLVSKARIFNGLKDAGVYGNENAFELSIENFVIEFDSNYYYGVKLLATEYSGVGKKLNAQEKVERYIGLENFPIPVVEGEGKLISYRFGGSSGYFIETNYGLDTNLTQGLYIGSSGMTQEGFNAYILALEEYGAELYDIIKDGYSGKHYIYKCNETFIDFQYSLSAFEDNGTLNIWIYNGTLVRSLNITEILNSNIPWFDINDFVKLDGTYEYNYSLFKLRDYAGQSFSEEAPLYCLTIDTQENIRDSYNMELIKKGYTQYMQGNYPYTYTSRGQTHYLFTKGGIFLDVACYPTTDYTYAGHDEYEYRLEVLIYEGPNPLTVTTYDNLDVLSNLYAQKNIDAAYSIELPEDSVVEIWRNLNDFKISTVEYGYGCRDEAFIYTEDIEGAYEKIKEGVLAAGYELSIEKEYSAAFSKNINGEYYYIGVFKEPEKGYVRFMNDVLGVDFSK